VDEPLQSSRLSDGYGNELTTYEMIDFYELLPKFERWLHWMANYYLPWNSPEHDDLVQEGRIAMWNAAQKNNYEGGPLNARWLTRLASRQMKDCVRRNLWTGQPREHGATRSTSPEARFIPGTGEDPTRETIQFLTLMDDDWALEQMLGAAELLEGIELAYHRGEILQAIAALPLRQQRYVVLRFWGGMGEQKGDGFTEIMGDKNVHSNLWKQKNSGARDRLRKSLAHLA
jgi:RNA polymerase sigma factor (sigma-70 family)